MKTVVNRIEENMTEFPSLASLDTAVGEAYAFMVEMGIRHLPVVDGDKVLGIVSERDLKQARMLRGETALVGDVMTRDPYCVNVGTSLGAVAKQMALHKYGSVVIVNAKGRVVGIFTTTDAMRILSEILDTDPGASFKNWAVERLVAAGPWMEAATKSGV